MKYQHLYIYKASPNTFKFGIYNNDRHERIIDGQTYYSDSIELLALFKIYKLPGYKLYENVDSIISRLCRKPLLLKNFNIDLKYIPTLVNGLINNGGGTEHCLLNYLNIFISAINIDYPKLDLQVEHYTLEEINKVKDYLEIIKHKINKETETQYHNIELMLSNLNTTYTLSINNNIQPNKHQLFVLWNCMYNFIRDKKGLLLWTCGLGKTIMSLLICCNKFKCNNILIGVPSINLLLQWNDVITKTINVNNNNIEPILCYNNSTNKHLLNSINTRQCNIVLTTYHSSIDIKNICDELGFKFDIKIGDEAHHLVTKKKEDNTKTFDKYHLIPSEYSLFMTATLKNINKGSYNETDYIFNMDDKDKYGCIIDEKTINWAIDNKKITDYKIVCINNNDDYINNLLNKINIECNNFHKYNKELVMSAYCALKAINDNLVSHILLYTNKRQSAFNIRKIIDNLINMYLFDNINKSIINDSSCFYNKELYSDNKFYHDYKTVKNCNICNTLQTNTCDNINHKTSIDCKNNIKKCIYICKNNKLQIFHNDNEAQDCEICKFKKAKYGIISCVYIFGEGFDLPCLNGVVICEQMTSEIRIVQSCLRPNRLNINDPDKLAYIIIPENIDNINDKNDKLFSVIKEMSMSDNTIEQKINIIDINNNNDNICYVIDNKIKLKQNKNLLNKVLLEAYDRKYFGESLHLKNKYELYKRLINGTYSTVKEYKDCKYKVIENPYIYFGKYWENNWFTFLGIDTSKWIPTLTEWRQHCKQKNIENINDYKNNMDDLMPPEPDHFYKGFRNFEIELNITTHDIYY